MRTKGEDECFYITAFMHAIELAGTIEAQPDGTGPDFAIVTPQRVFGVEVTRIHSEPNGRRLSLRQMEGIRDQVLEGAQAIWDSEVSVNVEVHVHWARPLPTKAAIPEVARSLVTVVRSHLPEIGNFTTVASSWRSPNGLPASVDSLSIVRLASYDRSYWVGGAAEIIGELTPDIIQARIDAKSRKVSGYRTIGSETWLLLVLDSHRLSGMFELPESLFTHGFVSSFERTSLLDTFHCKAWDLNCVPPVPGSAT
jgi:hypothetical protein